MKKFISMVMSLVLMLSLVPSAFAASKPQVSLSHVNIVLNGVPVNEMHFVGKTDPQPLGNGEWTKSVDYDFTPSIEVYNIDGSNYFKLRDIAFLLKGTDSSISVNYSKASNSVRFGNGGYKVVGGECQFDGIDKSASAVPSTQKFVASIRPEGAAEASYIVVYPSAYSIGGNNFLKLRDILSCIESTATVDWDDATKTIVLKSLDYKGSHEEQVAYDFAKYSEEWGDELMTATIAVRNELVAQGKLSDTMSVFERAEVFRTWVKQIPNQGIEYHGFNHPSIREMKKSVIIDRNALNSDCYQVAFGGLFYTDCFLCGMTWSEIMATDVRW